jgi:hypothetical protein
VILRTPSPRIERGCLAAPSHPPARTAHLAAPTAQHAEEAVSARPSRLLRKGGLGIHHAALSVIEDQGMQLAGWPLGLHQLVCHVVDHLG